MRWHKLGRVFCPAGESDWMQSHAANCAALRLDANRYRILFSTRDTQNRASVGWVEIDLRDPTKVLTVSPEPTLQPGPVGAFDDSGVSLACILTEGALTYLYYTGWNLGVTVPWRNSIGLAVSTSGQPFERVSPAPVLDRNHVDPFSLSYPFVMHDASGWRMWYGSNLRWGPEQKDMDHVIKYAAGVDPEKWSPTGITCIGIERSDEFAFSRPCIVRDGSVWKMWYSYRGASYRIGYAESADAVHWTRQDTLVGIAPSPGGWDSESVEYPWVFDHDEDRYMLYNGNRYGLTGFGLAVLESD
ncbi:MAG: hypothetical protein M3P06_14365 [Acidobacteriota bacterium]|nr:hypothetical protein [Acidobacteriota bacterium]